MRAYRDFGLRIKRRLNGSLQGPRFLQLQLLLRRRIPLRPRRRRGSLRRRCVRFDTGPPRSLHRTEQVRLEAAAMWRLGRRPVRNRWDVSHQLRPRSRRSRSRHLHRLQQRHGSRHLYRGTVHGSPSTPAATMRIHFDLCSAILAMHGCGYLGGRDTVNN